MLDATTADREVTRYIRPHTFPVALRLLKAGAPIPERARRLTRDWRQLVMEYATWR
jgi:hypothetical protein